MLNTGLHVSSLLNRELPYLTVQSVFYRSVTLYWHVIAIYYAAKMIQQENNIQEIKCLFTFI